MRRAIVLMAAFLVPAARAAQAAVIDFESPTYSSSAAGTQLTGQNGWVTPSDDGPFNSASGSVYTGAGNTVGITSTSAFAGLRSPSSSTFARSEKPMYHDITLSTWTYQFDVCFAPNPDWQPGDGRAFFNLAPRSFIAGDPVTHRGFSFLWEWRDGNTELAPGMTTYSASGTQQSFFFSDLGGTSNSWLTPGTWYTVHIETHPGNNAIGKIYWFQRGTAWNGSFYTGGSGNFMAGGENGTLPAPTGVRLNNLDDGGAVGFDNLTVSVPEPASALLMCGAALVLRWRRR